MLAEKDALGSAAGRLSANDPQADRGLREAIAAGGAADAAIGAKGIAVPLTAADGGHYVAHVLPLTSGTRRQAGIAYAAVAAVFDLPHPIETIAATFKLTPAELRVLMMIVEVGGVPEVAPVLGIAETTVNAFAARVREDGHQAPGRPGQARGRT